MSPGANRQDTLDPLQREAIAWVVRLTSGEATAEDADTVKAWRARSAAHEDAFRRASIAWHHIDSESAATAGVPGARVISRRRLLAGAAVGTALAAGWAGASLGILPTLESLLSDHATGVGEQVRVELQDGSAVYLDGASALDVRLTSTERVVRLLSGAAVFDVATDERPFHSLAGAGEITTLDGAFAVTLGAGEAIVECTRHEIAVSSRVSERLASGERVTLTETGVSSPERIDPAAVAPWRQGLLVFENRPLSQVVADINRHRRGRVVLVREDLGERRVNGVFHLDRPDEIVASLASSLKLASITLPAGIVFLR